MMKKIALTPRCYKKRRRVNDTGIESLKSTVVKNLMSHDTVPLTPHLLQVSASLFTSSVQNVQCTVHGA